MTAPSCNEGRIPARESRASLFRRGKKRKEGEFEGEPWSPYGSPSRTTPETVTIPKRPSVSLGLKHYTRSRIGFFCRQCGFRIEVTGLEAGREKGCPRCRAFVRV